MVGWRFRKVFQAGPLCWTWTKKGIGISWGIPGFRYGISSSGHRYISFGIPGTGFYFIKYLDKRKASPTSESVSQTPSPRQGLVTPKTPEPWWKQKNLLD